MKLVAWRRWKSGEFLDQLSQYQLLKMKSGLGTVLQSGCFPHWIRHLNNENALLILEDSAYCLKVCEVNRHSTNVCQYTGFSLNFVKNIPY